MSTFKISGPASPRMPLTAVTSTPAPSHPLVLAQPTGWVKSTAQKRGPQNNCLLSKEPMGSTVPMRTVTRDEDDIQDGKGMLEWFSLLFSNFLMHSGRLFGTPIP